MVDVIVIGGGIGGLAAAGLSARAGNRVVLCEQGAGMGGRAATHAHGEFRLNLGPHALYQGEGKRVLDELGVEVEGAAPPSGQLAYQGGRLHTLPSGFVSLLSTGLLTLAGKIEVGRRLAGLGAIETGPIDGMSVREWLAREVKDEGARRLIEAVLRLATYANAPETMSAGAALANLQVALEKPVLYLHGGWGTIVEGLEGVATKAGVEIVRGARVERIEMDGGVVKGVQLEGGRRIAAGSVMLAGGPEGAVALAPEVEVLGRWAKEAIPVRAACLDLALGKLPRPRAHFALGIDRPLYLSVHSVTARLAPAGGAVMHVAKYLDPFGKQDAEADLAELEELADQMQPGWREEVVERRWRPHLTVTHAVVTAAQGGLSGRPGPSVPGVRGLYVVGDWVGPEGMLADAALASARRAAAEVSRLSLAA